MNYTVTHNGKIIAQGLSAGELNQLLLDFDKQSDNEENKEKFRADLGFKEGDFEDFLYSRVFEENVYMSHNGGDIMTIEIE